MLNILGINIATLPKKEILQEISDFLRGTKQHYIATVNPEFLLRTLRDEEFFYILNQADINVADGVGLQWAAMFLGKRLPRITGVDLMWDMCRIAAEQKKSVYLVGGAPGVAEEAAACLQAEIPALAIAGAESGLQPDEWRIDHGRWVTGREKSNQLQERINAAGAEVVFVAFGHPRQEKWIYHALAEKRNELNENVTSLKKVKVAMGVGGSFDYIAGRVRRAPKLVRAAGFEWLWRLVSEPQKRFWRIVDAVIKFPWAFFKWRYILPFLYRPNVLCLLYKQDEHGTLQALLVKRAGTDNHWQLPQGGTEGEPIETAGSRELWEELGTEHFATRGIFENIYRYKFGKPTGRYAGTGRQVKGYKGQQQSLYIAEFTGSDDEIDIKYWDHDDWKWVDIAELPEAVHKVRRAATRIAVSKMQQITN